MKVLVDAGLDVDRKAMLRSAGEAAGLEAVFVDEAAEEEYAECEALLQSFGPAARIAENVGKAKNLRMLQTISAGVDSLPFGSIPESVIICSNAGAFSEPMAEHVFAMILSLSKRLKLNEMKLRLGEFDQQTRTIEIRGKLLGIVGYGGIGKAVAALGRSFGMKIYGISRNAEDAATCDLHGGLEKLEDLLAKSDVVVLAIPLNKTTRGLIDASRLSLMKENAILVNVARGNVIVERDLFEHLKSHPGFGAGIDAWWKEPRHGEPFSGNLDFISLPNVVGSPHNSSIVDGLTDRIVSQALRNIETFSRGERPRNIVRREDYVHPPE